jgi:hypothetical protein
MKLRSGLLLAALACCSAVVLAAGAASAAPSAQSMSGPASHHLTWAALRAMPPAQLAALQNPLIAAGTPVSVLGHTARWSELFSVLSLDTPDHVVDLCVTDPARTGLLLAAAKKADPSLNPRLIRVLRARYSLEQLNNASSRLTIGSQG